MKSTLIITFMVAVTAIGAQAAGISEELLETYGHAPTAAELYAETTEDAPAIQGGGKFDDGVYRGEVKVDAFALDGQWTWQEVTAAIVSVAAGTAGAYALGEDQGWWGDSSSGSGDNSGGGGGSGGNSGNNNRSTTIYNYGELNYQSQDGSNDESAQSGGESNLDENSK